MNLFNAIDNVVKVRGVSYSEIYKMPYYEFQFILNNMETEEKKRKEETDKQESESNKGSSTNFKPIDTNALMQKQQNYIKNIKPKY